MEFYFYIFKTNISFLMCISHVYMGATQGKMRNSRDELEFRFKYHLKWKTVKRV